jgi:transposase
MDVHREFAQLAVVEDGLVRDEGRIGVTPEALRSWAGDLRPDDQVALEATGNSDAIAALLTPVVARVVVSNPSKTRAIAEAKVKTDKVDARILAQLLAADFLPPVWLPDERTRALRRQVTRRAHLVRQRTRIKNQVHAILARNLAPTPPVSDLFGKRGRHWLSMQPLPGRRTLQRGRFAAAAGLPRWRAGGGGQGADHRGVARSGGGSFDDHPRRGRDRWHGDRTCLPTL